jgi:hypothetical protein
VSGRPVWSIRRGSQSEAGPKEQPDGGRPDSEEEDSGGEAADVPEHDNFGDGELMVEFDDEAGPAEPAAAGRPDKPKDGRAVLDISAVRMARFIKFAYHPITNIPAGFPFLPVGMAFAPACALLDHGPKILDIVSDGASCCRSVYLLLIVLILTGVLVIICVSDREVAAMFRFINSNQQRLSAPRVRLRVPLLLHQYSTFSAVAVSSHSCLRV